MATPDAPKLYAANVKYVRPGSDNPVNAVAVGPATGGIVRMEPSGLGYFVQYYVNAGPGTGYAEGRGGQRRAVNKVNQQLHDKGIQRLVSPIPAPQGQDFRPVFDDSEQVRVIRGGGREVVLFQRGEEIDKTVFPGTVNPNDQDLLAVAQHLRRGLDGRYSFTPVETDK